MSKKFLSIARLFILSMFLFLPSALHAEIFFQDDFESGNLSQWEIFENAGDPCDSTGQITATTEDRFTGTYSAKFNIPVGDMCTFMEYNPWPNPIGQGGVMYWRFRLKYAANYDWGNNNGNKAAEIVGDRISRDNGARIILAITRYPEAWSIPRPADSHQAIPTITISANDNVKEGSGDEIWHPPNDPKGTDFSQNINTANPVYIVAGQWYTIEIYVKVNADNNNDGVININDVADGALTMWINGTKVIERNNLYTISAPSQKYYNTMIGGTINQPQYVVYEDTAFYFDDVIVSDTCSSCSQSYLQFSSATYDVSETGTTATITVTRSGSSTGTVSVDYATSNGSATAGSDYTATSGTLSWAPNETAVKTIQVSIINDTVVEGNETVNIALSNPNGAQISGTNPVVLTITDNDSTGGNTGGSGGEASGGSGCGFVKEDGKGQKAKGEGLAFAVMLIITLAGIALARRRTGNIIATKEGVVVMKIRKNSLIRIAAILFLLSIFWSASAFAQPNITGFSGSLSHGGTLTITGNGFGAKATAVPFKWEDFENGTVGNNISTKYEDDSQTKNAGEWINYRLSRGPIYSNTMPYSGSKSSYYLTQVNPEDFRSMGVKGMMSTEVYVSVYHYFKRTVNGGGSAVQKMIRIHGTRDTGHGPSAFYFSTPNVCGDSVGGIQNPFVNNGVTNLGEVWVYNNNPIEGQWNRLEMYAKLSDPGVSNGMWQVWTNLNNNIDRQNVVTRGAGITDVYNSVLMPGMVDTKDTTSKWEYRLDDVYIDTTRARVEVCNTSTWSTRIHCDIQIPSVWSDTSITITLNKGSFSNLNNAYLYVIDADGNVNENGYLLSDGSGNTTPPPPSSGSGGDTSASGGSGCGFVKDDNGKGQGAKGEGLTLMVMLIITLATIAIAKKAFKRKVTTGKVRRKLLNFKSRLILLALLFLFVVYTPAHATVYFYFDAEEGTVGNIMPNPPICSLPCSGSKVESDGTYQSSGGTPQGTKYFQWTTYNNQPNAYTEIHPAPPFPINNVIGKTVYLAYFFNFTRINGLDIWHESGQSADKGIEIVGNGIRWIISRGAWSTLASNKDHYYTVWTGNPSYHLNLALEHGDIYWPNQNGYSNINTLQLEYERWYAAVMVIKIAADTTGSIAFYIDGVKISEYNNIITSANNSPTITDIKMGGTIAQPAYDAPAHYRKFDALMLTDNWQDIVDGGYLSGGGGDTPPPSDGGDTASSGGDASGGSGCGFVKDDGKGQKAKGEGLAFAMMLVITLCLLPITRRLFKAFNRPVL